MFPQMLTVAIAVEPATKANGCLELIPGSHRMGRLDPLSFDGDTKVFDVRVEKVMEQMGVAIANWTSVMRCSFMATRCMVPDATKPIPHAS